MTLVSGALTIPDLETRNTRRYGFLVALVLIALLSAAFLERVTRLARHNELLAAEQSVRTLNTVLAQLLVRHALDGTLKDLGTVADTDPMAVLRAHTGALPGTFLGERGHVGLTGLTRGAWVLDTDRRHLVYLARAGQDLRWRLNAVRAAGSGHIAGFHLQPAYAERP